MQWILPILTVLHVVPAFFWAGTTIALAKLNGAGAQSLAYPQIGSAVVTMLAGFGLWGLLHRTGFGPFEQVLALGVVCAIAAAGVQSGMGLPALRGLKTATGAEAAAFQARIALSQKLASGLLVITVICMVTARYF